MKLLTKIGLPLYSVFFLVSNCEAQESTLSGQWNSFAEHLNVLECVSSEDFEGTIDVYSFSGDLENSISLSLEADIPKHFPEFNAVGNSQGIFSIAPTSGRLSSLACQNLVYKIDDSAVRYVFSSKAELPKIGVSFGIFNSINPLSALSPNLNWLDISNTSVSDTSEPLSGTLVLRNFSGEVTSSVSFPENLASGQTTSFLVSGAMDPEVGSYEFIPDSVNAEYRAGLRRYRPETTDDLSSVNFQTAISIDGSSGACDQRLIPLSTFGPADNWLEILNPLNREEELRLEIFTNTGELLSIEQISLGPYAQQHVYVNPIIGDNNTGTARLICPSSFLGGVVAQSLMYGTESKFISASLGTATPSSANSAQIAHQNTFLGALNWNKFVNNSSDAALAFDSSSSNLLPSQNIDQLSALEPNSIGAISLPWDISQRGLSLSPWRVYPNESGGISTIFANDSQSIEVPTYSLTPILDELILPLAIASTEDSEGELMLIAGKLGFIFAMRDGSLLPAPFLDISSQLPADSPTTEHGVQNIIFDPNFSSNGRIYVAYNNAAGDSELSRFVVDRVSNPGGNPNQADPLSQEILLTHVHSNSESIHNGGGLAFDNQGFLYWGMGDNGPQEDPEQNSRNLSNLAGTIMRIDVSGPSGYTVPDDNPFVSDPSALDEIWAYGVRNPYRLYFDSETERLFVADVGQVTAEEVSIAESGADLGWNIFEGTTCLNNNPDCQTLLDTTPPIHDYGRSDGGSVIGGFIYQGSLHPELVGSYIFGDFVSGRIWGLKESGSGETTSWERFELAQVPQGVLIASIDPDPSGEILIVDLLGQIMTLTKVK